jgi:REP element-mobilizing transposase RayT
MDGPTIIFVTVCTKDRIPWLACDEAHRLLIETGKKADAWLIGKYVLMPDHLHTFTAPRDLNATVDGWISYWKSQFSKGHNHADWVWQSRSFHHRLRREDSYSEKWHYTQENPMRAGLVKSQEQWPFQGTLNELRW